MALVVTSFAYTGADQTFAVPAGVSNVNVYLWGSSGAGTNSGAGAMIQGVLAVTPLESLTVMVGGCTTTYGGGNNSGSGGGGRSAIVRSGGVELATAGAGGAGLSSMGQGGAGTHTGSGQNGYQCHPSIPPAMGGTQSAGGAGSTYSGWTAPTGDGGLHLGGRGKVGNGGGAGYYGGGGGSFSGIGPEMSGAGGSSFTNNLSLIAGQSVLGYTSTDSLHAPNSTSPYYVAGVAEMGGAGRVVITYANPLCFLAGTRLLTPAGPRAIETLRPGCDVTLSDFSVTQVAAVQHTEWDVDADANGAAWVLPAGVLGAERDLVLTPRHGVLVEGRVVPAGNVPGARPAGLSGVLHYYHVRLPPSVDASRLMLLAEGVPCESLRG